MRRNKYLTSNEWVKVEEKKEVRTDSLKELYFVILS